MISDTPSPEVLAQAPHRAVLTVLHETIYTARSAILATHTELENGPVSLMDVTPALVLADAVFVHLSALALSLERYLVATDPERNVRLQDLPF
jgi:hypothetical protein